MTKSSFIKTTRGQWNEIREWNGFLIGRVCFHSNKEWKIVKTKNFKDITERSDETFVLNTFRTRDDLWDYLKGNKL